MSLFDHKLTGPSAKKASNIPPKPEGQADVGMTKAEGSPEATPSKLAFGEGNPGVTRGR